MTVPLTYSDTIGRFDITMRKWSKAGHLVIGRDGHNVIYDGQFMLVIGGGSKPLDNAMMTEKCSVSGGQVTCVTQTPELTGYRDYPEVFLVPAGFCKDPF